jgi:hypothetical protein
MPNLRNSPPPQDFSKYLFVKEYSGDTTLKPISPFSLISPEPLSSEFDDPVNGVQLSADIDLGFIFRFCEREFDRINLSINGFGILRDVEDSSLLNPDHYFDDGNISNMTIKGQFSSTGVLLCPWMSRLGKVFSEDSSVNHGEKLPGEFVHFFEPGIRFARAVDPNGEKIFISRWRTFKELEPDIDPNELDVSVLIFEMTIRSSGKIEFTYLPVQGTDNTSGGQESASIGIFVNDDSWNFRDLTDNLGFEGTSVRENYEFGGFAYSSDYHDEFDGTEKPYNISLSALPRGVNQNGNWPGGKREGATFFFKPPERRRKMLPRIAVQEQSLFESTPSVKRTGDKRLGQKNEKFDDRGSAHFGEIERVDFPLGLPRLFGNGSPGISKRTNVFGNFFSQGPVLKNNFENFLKSPNDSKIIPFVEDYGDSSTLGEGFFESGINDPSYEGRLSGGLSSKTQITIELPLNNELQIFSSRSAAYFYNTRYKTFSLKGYQTNPSQFLDLDKRPDDSIGYGPTGLVSVPAGASDPELDITSEESTWLPEKTSQVLLKRYSESFQSKVDSKPTEEERFRLPINHPLLVEKITVEFSVNAGPGWSNDRTVSSVPIGAYTYDTNVNPGFSKNCLDFSGPGVTVALFRNREDGDNPRDLLCKGTFTHTQDLQKNISSKITWGNFLISSGNVDKTFEKTWIFEPEGFGATGQTPEAVIDTGEDGEFSGRVIVPMTSYSQNGVLLTSTLFVSPDKAGQPVNAQSEKKKFITSLFSTRKFKTPDGFDSSIFDERISLKTVDSFGRASGGEFISSRTALGNEIVPMEISLDEVDNPFYLGDALDQFPQTIKDFLADESPNAVFHSTIPLFSKKESPYIIFPGDELSLSLLKARPSLASNAYEEPDVYEEEFPQIILDSSRHGLSHDLRINPGSIKIKVYGSLLQSLKGVHDGLNQVLTNFNVTEPISEGLVLDQFETQRTDDYLGTFSDHYMFGDLIKDGFRYKVFDKTEAQNDPLFSGVNRDFAKPPRKSERIRPRREFCGIQSFQRGFDSRERIFDSFVPSIQRCLEVDGTKPFIVSDIREMFSEGRSCLETLETIFVTSTSRFKNYGTVLFDMPPEFVGTFGESSESFINNSWNYSFPFEEKYKNVPRIVPQKIAFSSDFQAENLFNNEALVIEQKVAKVDHFLPGRFIKIDDENTFDFCLDINFNKQNLSKPPDPAGFTPVKMQMTNDDLIKFMFGFGDHNTLSQIEIEGSSYLAGHKYQPYFRDTSLIVFSDPKPVARSISISPIIRGWRYGIYSGISTSSSSVFRRGSYGQFRDMLEQRVFTKFFEEDGSGGFRYSEPPVTVRFVDDLDRTIDPLKTWSQNITRDASSSLPFFDGISNNRPEVDINNLGKTIVTLDI